MATVVEETTVVVAAPAGPKRDLHRMQRIFRGTKTKLATRPFTKEGTSAAITAVTMTQLKALTASLTAEEVTKALAGADPTPAVVAELTARAARFGLATTDAAAPSSSSAIISTLTDEEKAARDEALRKRAERFGVAPAENPLAAALKTVDPAVLAARESRFADPRAEEEKAAAERRAARFGLTATTKAAAATAPVKVAPVELTPEQQAALDARARRFGA